MPPKKASRKVQPSKDSSHTMRTRRKGPASPLPTAPASPARRGRTRQQTKPATAATGPQPSSRSQTPNPETESDSLAQVPESRSTSPPPRRATRSMSRSVTPGAAEQRPTIPPKKRAPAMASQAARPSNTNPDNPFADFKRKNKKRSRGDIEEAENAGEEPTPKRSRHEAQDTSNDASRSMFTESLPTIAEDSSADDVVEEVQRPPRTTLNQSRSSSRPPRTKNVNAEDASAEESSDNLPPKEARPPPNIQISLEGKPLTPKPIITLGGKSKVLDPITENMDLRNTLYKEMTGRNLPVPRYQKGHPKYASEHYRGDNVSGDEDDDEISFIIDEPSPAHGKPARRKSSALPFNGPGGKAYEETRREIKAARLRAQKRENKPIITNFRVDFPADSKSEAKSYTEKRLTEPLRSLCEYAEKNPDASLPTHATMPRLINFYADNEEAFQHDHPLPDARSIQDQTQPAQPELEAENASMSNIHFPEGRDVEQGAREVQAAAEPQTPTRQPVAQQSRSWLMGVTSLLRSPLKFLGRGNQPAEAATTNGAAVTSASSIEHLIPQTSDFAIPPPTATNTRATPNRSNTYGEIRNRRTPKTPSDGHQRRRLPQTEPRQRVTAAQSQIVPQTARRNNYKKDLDTPFHLRGVLNAERRNEIWAKEDEEKRIQDMEKKREEERIKRLTRVEEEDEHEMDFNGQPSRTGEKRKAPHRAIPRPEDVPAHVRDAPARHGLKWEEFNWEGTFTVPEDSDSEDEAEAVSEMNGDYLDHGAAADNVHGQHNANGGFTHQPASGLGYDLAVTDRIFGRPNAHISDRQHERGTLDTSKPGWDQSDAVDHVKRYTGTLFAQPAHIQANLDENKWPTTPRRKARQLNVKAQSLIAGAEKAVAEAEAKKLAAEQAAAQKQKEPQPETSAPISSPGTFSAPGYEEEDNENECDGVGEQGKEKESNDTPESVEEETSVLQPKPWDQTPPPKPKPSNAQLPQAGAKTSAELAKSLAKVNKYQPSRPSGLRNVTQMSPLHTETLTTAAIPGFALNMGGYEFDPEVIAAVMAIPDEDLIETLLPRDFFEEQLPLDPEVMNAVMRLLG